MVKQNICLHRRLSCLSFLHGLYIRTNLIIDGKLQKYSFSVPFVSCAQHHTLPPAPKQEQCIQQLMLIKTGGYYTSKIKQRSTISSQISIALPNHLFSTILPSKCYSASSIWTLPLTLFLLQKVPLATHPTALPSPILTFSNYLFGMFSNSSRF